MEVRVVKAFIVVMAIFCLSEAAYCLDATSLAGFAGGVDFDGKTNLSPVAADFDGDPTNGKELAVVTNAGDVAVYKLDGSLLWQTTTPNKVCVNDDSDTVLASPSAADLGADGDSELFVPYGGYFTGTDKHRRCGGGVIALDGRSGALLWKFDSQRSSKAAGLSSGLPSVVSTPTISDLNGDGKLEIIFGSLIRNIYVVRENGSLAFAYQAADTVFSSAAVADTDGNGKKEIIIATDISRNDKIKPPTKNGGYVYALDVNYALKPRLARKGKITTCYFRSSACVKWITYIAETIQSSPLITEVLTDLPGEEIVIGAGCYFGTAAGKQIHILGLDGEEKKSINTSSCMQTSPIAGDINLDGQPEVIALQSGSSSLDGDGDSRVTAFNPQTGAVVWEQSLNTSAFNHGTQPIMADFDGNGSYEVAVQDGANIKIYQGTDGTLLNCIGDDCDSGYRIPLTGSTKGVPLLDDLDGIPGYELAIATGRLFAFTDLSLLGSSPGVGLPYYAPVPMWRVSSNRDGNVE